MMTARSGISITGCNKRDSQLLTSSNFGMPSCDVSLAKVANNDVRPGSRA